MPASPSLTQQRAVAERDAEEAELLAENAHAGEKAVSWLRLLTWALLGVAFSGAEGPGASGKPFTAMEGIHTALIAGWFLFAVFVAVLVRRTRFTPARARRWPLYFSLVDFGCFVGLGATTTELPDVQVFVATLAILLAYSVARFNRLHVWAAAAMASAGYVIEAAAHRIFDWRVALVVLTCYLVLGTVVAWANVRVRRMFVDLRRSENLARFLPRQVARRILAEGGSALRPAQREVTILFSDIRDFTSLSERMEPAAVLALLDEYFGHMTRIVKGHDGMVNKFIGDGMLAVWGAPDAQADHAQRALRAALDMRRAMEELNRSWRASGRPELRIGVGVHTGTVAAGMLGGADQAEYTVIGDAVNLASRIEGLTKKLGTDILASEATWSRCEGRFAGERAGAESVKGREEQVVVYRVEAAPRSAA
jgi:adenylate cyclase